MLRWSHLNGRPYRSCSQRVEHSNPGLLTPNPIFFFQPLTRGALRGYTLKHILFLSHLREGELPGELSTAVVCLGMPWASRELVRRVVSAPRGHLGPGSPTTKGLPSRSLLQALLTAGSSPLLQLCRRSLLPSSSSSSNTCPRRTVP